MVPINLWSFEALPAMKSGICRPLVKLLALTLHTQHVEGRIEESTIASSKVTEVPNLLNV